MNSKFGRDFKLALFSIPGVYQELEKYRDEDYILVSYDQVSDDFQGSVPFNIDAIKPEINNLPLRMPRLEEMIRDSGIKLDFPVFGHYTFSIKKLLSKRSNFIDQPDNHRPKTKTIVKHAVKNFLMSSPDFMRVAEVYFKGYPYLAVDFEDGLVSFKKSSTWTSSIRITPHAKWYSEEIQGVIEDILSISYSGEYLIYMPKVIEEFKRKKKAKEEAKAAMYVSPECAEKKMRDHVLNLENGYARITRYYKAGYRSIVLSESAIEQNMFGHCLLSKQEAPATVKGRDGIKPARYLSIRKLMKDRYKFKGEKEAMMLKQEQERKQREVEEAEKHKLLDELANLADEYQWPKLVPSNGFKKGEMVVFAAGVSETEDQEITHHDLVEMKMPASVATKGRLVVSMEIDEEGVDIDVLIKHLQNVRSTVS